MNSNDNDKNSKLSKHEEITKHEEGINTWLDYLDKYRQLSRKLKELTEDQEQNLDEFDVDSFIEHDKEKEKLLSRLDMLKDKIFSCKEKYQDRLTDEQLEEIRSIQVEISENIKTALGQSKSQEKRLGLMQKEKRKKYQNLNKKQALKQTYLKKKNNQLKSIDKNKGSRFDEKN